MRAADPDQGAAWADPPLTDERNVRPILKARGFHGRGEGNEPKVNLDLRFARPKELERDSWDAFVVGKHEERLLSTLERAVR